MSPKQRPGCIKGGCSNWRDSRLKPVINWSTSQQIFWELPLTARLRKENWKGKGGRNPTEIHVEIQKKTMEIERTLWGVHGWAPMKRCVLDTKWTNSTRLRLPPDHSSACKFAKLCPSTKSLPQTDSKSSLRTSSPPENPREKIGCFTDLSGAYRSQKKQEVWHTAHPQTAWTKGIVPFLKWLGTKCWFPI